MLIHTYREACDRYPGGRTSQGVPNAFKDEACCISSGHSWQAWGTLQQTCHRQLPCMQLLCSHRHQHEAQHYNCSVSRVNLAAAVVSAHQGHGSSLDSMQDLRAGVRRQTPVAI